MALVFPTVLAFLCYLFFFCVCVWVVYLVLLVVFRIFFPVVVSVDNLGFFNISFLLVEKKKVKLE
jgi:hypothetical protein